jgi:dTDP-4-dehydrorhamnose reductase
VNSVDILVVGGSGFVGAKVVETAASAGYQVAYTYANHNVTLPACAYQVKLEEKESLAACLADTQPQIIVYCAVPQAQAEEKLHRLVSVEGVRRVLASLDYATFPVLFIYVSTNAVFSGRHGPYQENDEADPAVRRDSYRTYALTRFEGEKIAQANWPNTIIVRTATVNGRDVKGKLNSRLAMPVGRLQMGQPVARFRDRYISPTLVDNLVAALLEVISPDFTYRGILHLTGSQRVTDYEYTRCLARCLGIDENLVKPDYMADSPLMVNCPRDNSLNPAFAQNLLKTPLLGVEEQLSSIFP